ncbi:ankyrin-2-like isoform X8 [Planococcus citri]|uniref:ankyrin-2-like isoform X8 n=1 Tax=Planococcus citri TaxID=170843 RepID=UPI0031F95773
MADQVQEPIQNHKAPADHLLKNVDLGPPQQPQKKTDGNTAFLRAARSGNLEKVLEFINANVDINTSNSNGLNALHLASKDGHVEVAAELLKRGANVDAATKKGNTALHIASLAGQEEVVKLLIEHGASVNLQSQSGFTPLYMAAQENHERVVRYLLNNGANQSLATEDGFTPLAVAMQQGHDKVVTELLENDTRGKIKLPALHIAAKKDDCKAAALLLQSEHNPDITSKSGFTPLHIASHYGNDAIASLLLAKGADVNYAAKHNITPLHVAAKWGRNNMVILLLDKGASIIAKTRDGLTPLHCAARSGHEQVVDTLLQRHAPITAKTKNGLAPLHMASQGDHVEAARVLLSHRAPVDDVTVDYLTALHVASHCGHVSVAKLLLDRKADPNARALNGFTPLHIACKKNRVKIVELLLKHGGSIEATTESGLSPLHVASFMGCMNIVIYLLQCGANPDVSTIRGETPLHLASRANQTDIIRILLRNGAQVDAKAREQQTPLHIAARLGNTDIVMLLLQHGANVDSVTKDLYTSLHIAAKEDQEEVAQALLENNASMTATTKKGFTPLHLAAKYGRSSIATLLLQRGAPVDAQGKNGVTPLHVASHYDHQGIALLLLDKGASPHATAKNGHTPLHIAAKKNQMDIAAMLLEYGANAGAESKAGFTPLHLSAQEGHVDMTNLLLEHKADVNHSSKNGLTPLHLCAQEDCVDVATILVKNGADVNNVTKAGYTPLHIASHFGQLNMVRFLLSNKAKVDTATSTGYTPLHQAAQQGNSAIVAVLLDNGASPDTKNNQGQTALCIAQKLGYISVVEVLKNVTDNTKAPPVAAAPTGDEKYKVVAPETMQENFMSDSEDEGGDEVYMAANGTMSRMCDSTLYLQYYEKNTLFMREDATNEQSYRYLTIDEMKSLGDDSLPIDTSKEDRYDTTAGHDESISPQHTYNQLSAAPVIDNVDVTRAPVIQTGKLKWKSFLVSFLVDAKGGAMRGCRHSGVRVIVPPQCVTMPTRVTCRYIRRDKPNHPPPPPLMEGEALASRILELGPVGVKFLGPVVIEVPNFAALRANEREIVILRSDNGETWREHTVDSSSEAVHDILSRSFDKDGNQIQSDEPNRITSIVTHDFPHYFAIVSRIRQEVHAIGPEGGMVSSSVVPQVQAVFPQGALTKKIKVGLQAQPIPSELTAAVLGNCVAVSPIVTIEPRRRKFHKPITLTLPVPQAANKGMINQYSGDAPTLRLLCSITGGTSRAQWEDVTGSTPLTFVKECVSFTTTVSARFWLMDIRDIAVATKKATELYREAIHIPFMAKFVVFAKRIDNNEARLRVFCMTDDKEDKTLENQEHFTEVAKSRDVEVLEGKKQLIELSGNLISVTKSGDQLKLGFNAFQENRLPFTIRIKDSLADPIGRMLFFKEQKPVKTSTPHPPICVLNIVLPDTIIPDSEFGDSPIRKYNLLNDSQGYHRSELKFSDISNLIGEDWEALAEKLGIRSSECKVIKIENPEGTARQSSVMLKQWNQRAGTKATANILESALLSIGREDIVQECFLNTNQKNKLPNENGLITHKAEDIRGSKKDPYSNFLSPKPLMTPPPSPAEFSKEGSEEWHKTDSLDSNRSNKSVTDIETPSETQTVTPTEYTGNKQLSTESDTTRSFSRDLETDTVDKEESMDYVSRKKFWQSFESASVDKVSGTATSSAPVPKPRASICTTGVTIEEAPVAAKRSTENIRSGFVVSKSESMQERVSSDTERFSRPSMKKVHSLMSYSTDSEAEYIATCGIEKLAYENVAFSEEDESISEAKPEPEVESGVKARKMFFEKMQSNSSQESITSPPSKKDEIAGIVKTSIVSTEKQIKKDSSPDSVPSQICETDKHVSLVKSATASIEKRIEQPVKRDSSQESITSPLSKKDEIISGVTNEKPLKKDSSLDSVSSTSSKKVENVGLVKSATASIEKRIEQPMKRDSSQESVTSPLSKKDEIISGVTDEKPLKKDSSLDSVSSTSSKKVENVGLVKSATASIEKRIEQPVKRDSSQESVTSPVSKKDEISGVTAGAPLKTNSSLDGASSTLSKKDGLVKSATASIEKRIEQPVKRDSSQEKVTSPLTKKDEIIGVASEKQIRKDSSQDSISSTPSKKDDHVSLVKSAAASIEKQIEKEQSTTGLVENTTKVIKTGSIEKIETPVKKEPSQESISNVSLKKDSPVIHMESVTSSIEQIIKQESSKENITSLPSKKDEIVHTTPTTILSNQENLEQPLKKDSFVTSDKKEEVVKTTIAKEPTKTITKKEDVEITTSEKVEPSVTTKVKETVVTTSSASKIDAPVVTTKVEETVVTTSPEGKLVTTIIKEETSTESIEKHLSSKIDEKIVSIHKVTEQPVKGDVSLKKVPSKDESLSQVETTAVITTTKTFEEPVIKDSSKEVVTCEQLVCSIPTTTLSSTTVTTTRTQSKPSIDKDSSIESVTSVSSKQGDLSNLIKSTVTTSISITEKSISKDPSLDSVTSLSFKADEPAGVISENSQCKDSICDSSSLSSKKDRPIEATDIVKLDTQSPSTIESKPNGSLDESIDSTQSESDITPEDLRDKQFIMQDWESTSELLENLVQDRTIPMAQSSGIVVQEISQSQIRFSDSEQYKHFNSTPAFSEDDSECEALKEEAKAAAENLINEIEEELGKRPDIVECLLKNKIDELVEEIASSSNDITDEDLKSTGTEIDLPMPYGFEDPTLMKMKISQASPTEYEIKFEQVEEFNVLESVDFEEPIIPDDMEIGVQSGSESLMSLSKKEVIKPSRIPIRNGAKSSAESKSPVVQRKTSEEDKSRTSTSPEYVQDFIEIRQAKHHRKSGADFEPCSSSSESHYHSFEHSGTTSRPLSSDVEGLLSGGGVPGTTGSSEYETAASHDTSHDFHTAMSSASLHESIKSIDSESSGNLGSAEVSSEVSETLVASSAELDHDIDLPPSHYYDDNTRRSAYRSSPIEPYDHDIPMEVIKGVSQSFDMSHLEPFANSQKKSVEPALQVRSQSAKFREDLHEIDDKLLSSSEDVSMFSLTDGGTNLQTVIEVNSAAESDKMDNSIISEQSLTISATSNQFSTSSSAELKDEIEGDKKPGDLNSVQSTQDLVTKSSSNASATCAQISSSKIDKSDSKDTICRDISIDDIPNITIQHSTPPQHPPVADIVQESPSKDPSISPDSESFELIEQPDMMDDFVIIEEVAKEACEQDPEGKSIKITGKRQIAMSYDDEIVIPPKTSSTLTRIEYYGGADGCGFPIEGVPEVASKPAGDENDVYEHEVEEGKKWIEMQFQADSEDASGYEYGYERGPLEDIKEEDTDDMQSSKMGSVGSQISQSIGSLGSMKQSLSSTPDYDILAGKRYFANKSSDKDDVSQGSLQEFERLEQLMTLESVKNKLSGSQDSLGSNNSTNGGGSKKRSATGDDVSVSSLNEFEGLEHACLEAEKVKERARIEEHLLSQIEEGHESQASESESCETLEKSCYESDNDEDYDQKMFEIDEIIRQAQSNVEKFVDVDQLERTESLGRGDSFEETARIPDFELDQPLTENTHSSSDIYSGKKYIEHFDLSHSLTTSTDSLEPKGKPGDILVTSTDSLEGGPTTATTSKSKSTVISDSLDATDNRVESPRSAYDADEELQIGAGDDFDTRRLSPHHLMLSSPDSLDATSSAGTHATYHNETDSAMSSSFTSAGSNTMISSTENLENIVTNYSNWLDSNPYMTEVAYNVSDKSYVTTERVAESSNQQRTTSSQGQDAKKLYEKDMAAFQPGEYYSETREVDSDGNVHIKKVVESRAVVTSEKVQSSEKIILDPEQYRGHVTNTDFTTVSSSSSHFVTTTTSTTTESSSGFKTESNVRVEKKEVSGEGSSDKPKS